MPLYEYECGSCGHRFELIQKFSDPPVESCPSCGGQVRKLLSSPAIHFKGSGWYITDYAGKGKKSEAASEGAAQPAAKASEGGETAKAAAAGESSGSGSTSSSSTSSGSKPSKA